MNTHKDLPEILEQRNKDGRYTKLIKDAKNYNFHDFKSNEEAFPKMALAERLLEFPELKDVRDMVLQGKLMNRCLRKATMNKINAKWTITMEK